MTRKGEYAVLHTTSRSIGFQTGISEWHSWSCVRAASCFRDGRVKEYLEAPGRTALSAGCLPGQAFLDIPDYAQAAARRLFEAQTKFETADELYAALEMGGG